MDDPTPDCAETQRLLEQVGAGDWRTRVIIVRYPPSSFVVRMALPMAWLLLAGAPARAGYCSLASQDPLWQASGVTPLVFGAAEWEDSSKADGLAVIDNATLPPGSAPQPPVDFRLTSLHQQLPFGQQAGGCSTSSPSPPSVTGSTGQPEGLLDKPELPRDERGRRLALESNSWDLPSFPSRLFRPPRAG
jgi:hypothetical protein